MECIDTTALNTSTQTHTQAWFMYKMYMDMLQQVQFKGEIDGHILQYDNLLQFSVAIPAASYTAVNSYIF